MEISAHVDAFPLVLGRERRSRQIVVALLVESSAILPTEETVENRPKPRLIHRQHASVDFHLVSQLFPQEIEEKTDP